MTLQVESNKTMFGKRIRFTPLKPNWEEQTTLGSGTQDAKDKAMERLAEAFKYNQLHGCDSPRMVRFSSHVRRVRTWWNTHVLRILPLAHVHVVARLVACISMRRVQAGRMRMSASAATWSIR
jgi:hypothetical protein